MAARTAGDQKARVTSKSVPELGGELVELVKGYAKQEVVDPIKPLGRFLGWGLAGSVVTAVGFVFLVVGTLRVLQVEWEPTKSWTWVPYLVVLIGTVLLIGFYVKAIRTKKDKVPG